MQISDIILMCKDTPVYNVTQDKILHEALLPGALLNKTLSYVNWMRTRYSAGSNVSARRLMLRAFGTDNHNSILKRTRALSLSDCYWLKESSESISFYDVTPYLHEEWDGTNIFTGGSISTLFVNGAADKRWLNSATLLKVASRKELEPYKLGEAIGLKDYQASATLSAAGLLISNFTSVDTFLESAEQSGKVGENDDARYKAVDIFGERAVGLFVLDYLVEHDDRHWGNFGFMRDASTGNYLEMSPYYDFDWAWSAGVVDLPDNAISSYSGFIHLLCSNARLVASDFEHHDVIKKRAEELSTKV